MRYLSLLHQKSFGLLMVALVIYSAESAQAADSGNNNGPAASKELSVSGPNGKLDFQTDLFTGRFGYTVPIVAPPGRNGTEPSLRLRYTSGNDNGWCGLGWELEIGYIQRETRKGVPVTWSASGAPLAQYDDGKGFIFNFNGASGRLVNLSANEFRAEIDTEFLRFNYLTNSGGNSWLVTDK